MKKTFNITRSIETETVDIPGYPDYVVVYIKWSDGKNTERLIMTRKIFGKIKNPKDFSAFKAATIPVPHQIAQRDRQFHQKYYETAVVFASSPEDLEAYKTYARYPKLPKWLIKWGETIPDGWTLSALCVADGTRFDVATGELIVRPVRDFYLARNYDIDKIVDDWKKGTVTDLIPCDKRNPIRYVPGNGMSLDLDIVLSPEQYAEFMTLDMWRRKTLLDEKTSLSRYKRAEDLKEEEPSYSWGDSFDD